jgi:hypothetical protein
MLLRVILGLEPEGAILKTTPLLPPEISLLRLRGIRGRFGDAEVVGRRRRSPTTRP